MVVVECGNGTIAVLREGLQCFLFDNRIQVKEGPLKLRRLEIEVMLMPKFLVVMLIRFVGVMLITKIAVMMDL